MINAGLGYIRTEAMINRGLDYVRTEAMINAGLGYVRTEAMIMLVWVTAITNKGEYNCIIFPILIL